jgi:ATP/maltotriose-dependent transcriptional regulator MalT
MAAGEQGDPVRAVKFMRQGLGAGTRLQDRRLLLMESNMVVWWLARDQGNPGHLGTLLGAAEAMGDAIEPVTSGWRKTRTPEAAAALQARLGKDRWDAAFRQGRSLSFSRIRNLASLVLDEVEAGPSSSKDANVTRRHPTSLSKREEEVLRLVAEGLTNKEIARQLIVTEKHH